MDQKSTKLFKNNVADQKKSKKQKTNLIYVSCNPKTRLGL